MRYKTELELKRIEEQKKCAVQKALEFLPRDAYVGIGTGSTVNHFIEALKPYRDDLKGAVTTSKESRERLQAAGIPVVSLNDVEALPIYFDSADEVNEQLQMIKGQGGALLAEKIVASVASNFVCIINQDKWVKKLGVGALAVEVLPYARSSVSRRLIALGGRVELRLGFKSESGNEILDVYDLDLSAPLEKELEINSIPGVVENGLFAHHPANVLVIAGDEGVEIKKKGTFFKEWI